MTQTPPVLPPASWYADPQNPFQQRWWTGAMWGEHTRPTPLPEPPPQAQAWQTNQSFGAWQPQETMLSQTNSYGYYDQSARPPRRGFFDSPFERRGTRTNRPGTLSLTFALLPFALTWFFPPIGLLLGIAFGVAAIVLGIVGIAIAGRFNGHRGTAIAGLIVGIVAVGGAVGVIALAVNTVMANTAAITTTAEIPTPERGSITSSAILEAHAEVSIRGQIGESVTVDCPENISTSRGSSVACIGTYPSGRLFDLAVTFLRDDGPFSWDLTPRE